MNPALLLIDITILLALAALFLPLMRTTTAASRHFLCIAALAFALLIPALSLLPAAPAARVFTFVTRASTATSFAAPAPMRWLSIVWIGGAILMITRFLSGVIYLRLRTRLPESRLALPGELASLLRAHGIAARLAPVTTPVVWGCFRPEILLPKSVSAWPEERLRIAVLHEVAHVRRGDLWTVLISAAAQIVYWFHPLVWWISTQAAGAQELACDDRVLDTGVAPPEYAALLVDTARHLPPSVLLGCPMASRSNPLRGRIMHILEPRSKSRPGPWSRGLAWLFPALLIGTGLLVSAASGQSTASHQEKIYKIAGDVRPPIPISKNEPRYTDAARDAKIQGPVTVSMIINKSGIPRDVTVVQSLDPGLDKNAVKTIRQWRFQAATKDGQPVSVRVSVIVNFRLK